MKKMHRIPNRRFRLVSLVFAAIFAVALAGCGKPADHPKSLHGLIRIAAAEDFYGEAAQAVGGKYVHVDSIINQSNMDPHNYEPTPRTAEIISTADIVIYNGLGYDSWMHRIASATSRRKSIIQINVSESLMHKNAGENEHVWYNPRTIPTLTLALAQQLKKLDPPHSDYYTANAQRYIQSLQPIDKAVRDIRKTIGTQDIQAAVSEPVFDQMLQALHIHVHDRTFELAVDAGMDPAPKAYGQLEDDLRQGKVSLFINNTQNESRFVQHILKLARSSNIPVVDVTETKPAQLRYADWMTRQLAALKKALTVSDASESS